MGQYDKEVEAFLGRDIVKLILSEVSSGRNSSQQMKDIAFKLPADARVGGSHCRRVDDERRECDSAEMRCILSDWWQYELCDKDQSRREEVVDRVIDAFQDADINLKPLAKSIKDEFMKNPPTTSVKVRQYITKYWRYEYDAHFFSRSPGAQQQVDGS